MGAVSEHRPIPKPPEMPSAVRIGIDVGQRRDPTAIVVAELVLRQVRAGSWDQEGEYVPSRWDGFHLVRHVQRLPLGTPYPQIAARLASIVDRVTDRELPAPTVIVDATGVGRPIVDLLRQHLIGYSYRLLAATFVAGEKLRDGPRSDELSVGKAYLVSRLQALLQTGHVRFPDTPEARTLADELQNYEIRVTSDANVQAGAFRSGTHDDLATALGLAVLLPYQSSPKIRFLDPSQL